MGELGADEGDLQIRNMAPLAVASGSGRVRLSTTSSMTRICSSDSLFAERSRPSRSQRRPCSSKVSTPVFSTALPRA